VRLDGDATLCELDAYQLNHNFGDTLRRQAEHYYRKIRQGQNTAHDGEGIASPHDRVSFKHEITPEDMESDDRGKCSFRDSWQPPDHAPRLDLHYLPEATKGRGPNVGFIGEAGILGVEKCISLAENSLTVRYKFGGERVGGNFMTEINLAMPSCDGPAGRFIYNNGIPGGFGQPLALQDVHEIVLADDVLGGNVVLRMSHPAHFRSFPFFTVSQSEAGFEKIMQAVTILLEWPLDKRVKEVMVEIEVSKH